MGLSLASQLSPNNIPNLSHQHSIKYHIITRREDVGMLKTHKNWNALTQYASIEVEFIEDIVVSGGVPQGMDSEKYNFLSILQNRAISYSIKHDIIIFNYSDFIWSDGSLSNIVSRFYNDCVKSLLTFCLPVDHDSGVDALQAYRQESAGISALTISPRDCAALALNNLHRETKLRYWDDPTFSNTPTYLLWRVDDQGAIIRAYHQTILAMRVQPEDPEYLRGIQFGSLDGSYSNVVGERGGAVIADDSREIFAFSLYDTTINTAVTRYPTRFGVMQRLLTRIPLVQRGYAEQPIYVRAGTDDAAEEWAVVAKQSGLILQQYHRGIDFNPKVFQYRMTTKNVKQIAVLLIRIALAICRRMKLNTVMKFLLGKRRSDYFIKNLIEFFMEKSKKIKILKQCEKATRLFSQAMRLEQEISKSAFDLNHQDELIAESNALLEKTVAEAPLYAEPRLALGRNAWRQGRFELAQRHFADAINARNHFACTCGQEPSSKIVLPATIGEKPELLGLLETISKKKILEADETDYIIVLDQAKTCNLVFLEYFAPYLVIMKAEFARARSNELEQVYERPWDLLLPFMGETSLTGVSAARVQSRWEREGRQPLLRLKRGHHNHLHAFFREYGVSRDNWFVVLSDHDELEDYYPAINAITEAGGWVVRMAQTSAPALDVAKLTVPRQVIDYGCSSRRSPALDVAISAACRLFITDRPGLEGMARAFGSSCLVVNGLITPGAAPSASETFLPRRYISAAEGRLLSFDEILSSAARHANSVELCLRFGWITKKASPTLIAETVAEVLSFEGNTSKTGGEKGLKAFMKANARHGSTILGRPSRAFCRQYDF